MVEPEIGLLDRNIALKITIPELELEKYKLKSIINYSTSRFIEIEQGARSLKGTPLSLVALLHQAISISDGILLLVEQGCYQSSIPLLRSLLESSYYAEFMIKEKFITRSTAYAVFFYLKKISYYESFVPDSKTGKRVRAESIKDTTFDRDMNCILSPERANEQILLYNEKLKKAKFAEIRREIESNKKKYKKWYNIDNGPNNLPALAKYLNRFLQYQHYYKVYSSYTHASDLDQLLRIENGKPVYNRIRNINNTGINLLIESRRFFTDLLVSISKKVNLKFNLCEELMGILSK